MNERPCTIESGGLKLEGLLHEGTGDVIGGAIAVVLHPHPQYGGDMRNHVVATICEALADSGTTTLRFNFRGTGGSDGAYDSGRGEADDARAAVTMLRADHPGMRLILAGYSFGAMVAAGVAGDVRPDALVLVSPPAGVTNVPGLDADTPALLITGERDRVAPPEALSAFEGANGTIIVVPGVDHGWWPGVEMLGDAVRAFIGEQLALAT
jgi:alpha/beta superfamily hydrolase